ncbi:MAG TPA: hypothetical protein VGV40_11885 [Solirubrobacteraceae bacterium]|nr:hypothetical protein [Solirubrobacteraceae bacterium]
MDRDPCAAGGSGCALRLLDREERICVAPGDVQRNLERTQITLDRSEGFDVA